MKNKLIKLALISASFLLVTSCDTARARLETDKNEQISTAKVQVETDNLESLWRTIYADSSFNSNIKDMFVEQIAHNYFGEFVFVYNKTTYSYGIDVKINDEGKLYSEATNEEKAAFIKAHKVYLNWKDTGISISYEDSYDGSKQDKYDARVKSIEDIIFNKVIENVYSNFIGGSYRKNNRYYEILFARSVASQLYAINDENGNAISAEKIKQLYNNPDYSYENTTNHASCSTTILDDGETTVDTYSYGLLVDDKYDAYSEEGRANLYSGKYQLLHLYHYVDYINQTIVPGIQNNILTEQYIIDNQYPAIGRTQQRKVSYIKISDNSSKKAKELLTNYAKENLTKLTANQDLDFEVASEAWKAVTGVGDYTLSEEAGKIAKATFGEMTSKCLNDNITDKGTYIDGKANDYYSYYEGSKFADTLKDYSTLTTNPATNNSSNYSSFTTIDSLHYTPEEGLRIKADSLTAENYITLEKWGTKSDFSGLPSAVTSKLFEYGIVSEIKDDKSTSTYDRQYLKTYVANGYSFLKKDTYSTTDEYDQIIWKDGDDYYIIVVYDAIAPSVITKSATNDDIDAIEAKARVAGYNLASGSTYTSDSIEHYIAESEAVYFDQKVYEYFKSTYSDIFTK